jgi:hypothetical protein
MPSSRLALICLAAVLLAGCANQPMPGQNPTPARTEPAAPPPGGTAGSSTTPTYGASPDPDPAGGVTVQDESGTVTAAPDNAQREKDAEDCYTYAHASVARDIQVQDDRSAIFDQSSNNRDVYAFTNRLDEFGNEQRLGALYDDCMTSKGYAANQ